MEKLEGYTNDRKVPVDTEHKPLDSIMKKSLLSAPRRLWRMLLQKFDMVVSYEKGKGMHIADTLSRACLLFSSNDGQNEGEDVMSTETRSLNATEFELMLIGHSSYLSRIKRFKTSSNSLI